MTTEALPARDSRSINQLLEEGRRSIRRPARMILAVGSVLAALTFLLPCSGWWAFLVLAAGIAAMLRHTAIATPPWRIRAYAGVADIHQFQRSAELAGLLPRQSYRRPVGWMSARDRALLKTLQRRFDENEGFVDDPFVGFVTEVFRRSINPGQHHQPVLKISAEGIGTLDYGYFPWEDIRSETVDLVKGNTYRTRSSSALHDHTDFLFRFWLPAGVIVAFPLEELDTSAPALDLALQVHRGRWAVAKATALYNRFGSKGPEDGKQTGAQPKAIG